MCRFYARFAQLAMFESVIGITYKLYNNVDRIIIVDVLSIEFKKLSWQTNHMAV